mmetsp:Transcript_49740/g.119739  ORF Transcript_49740/g.119739 Transcript_49740/m.119739 type:complete len:283 (-) Transcript_49740:172-1020(-)
MVKRRRRSPMSPVFETGMPSPPTTFSMPGEMTSLHGIDSVRPSSVVTETVQSVSASRSVTRALWMRSLPSREKRGCAFSAITNWMSAGKMPGPSSPSLLKVMDVPAFQPALTRISRIFSSMRVVRPSGFSFLRVMRMRLVHPLYNSSSEHCSLRCTVGCFRGPALTPAPRPMPKPVNGSPPPAPMPNAPPIPKSANGLLVPKNCSKMRDASALAKLYPPPRVPPRPSGTPERSPSAPNWSYVARFSLSLNTSYASFTFLNSSDAFSSLSRFLSGCHFMASLR